MYVPELSGDSADPGEYRGAGVGDGELGNAAGVAQSAD